MFNDMWGVFSFTMAVFLAVFLAGIKMPRRKFFFLRIILCNISIFAVAYLLHRGIFALNIESNFRLILRTLHSLMIFVLNTVAIYVCLDCNWWAALFCGTAGYCMQHISRRIYDILIKSLDFNFSVWAEIPILTAITFAVYLAVYFVAIRKNNYDSIMTDNKVQIVIAISVVMMTIFLNCFANFSAELRGARDLQIYFYIFSIAVSVLALFVEFGLLYYKQTEKERDTIKQIMHQEREQYALEKAMIDVINVKSHDLKHQLSALEGKIDSGEFEKIKTAVEVYDSVFKTGNDAFDIVLTMKSLICESKNIRLTCMADGNKLSFLSETEIYSLFGNIIDNAIEAVEGFEDQNKRLISLTVTAKKQFCFIHAENYFADDLVFVDGLPQTTKEDSVYHGFGMRSIRLLAQKYNGLCTVKAEKNIFMLDIMLPFNITTA